MNASHARHLRSIQTAAAGIAFGLAGASTLALGSQAQASVNRVAAPPASAPHAVTLTISSTAQTPVTFRASAGARCLVGDGHKRPMELFADDNGIVRFHARPGRGAEPSAQLLAECDARGRHISIPLVLRAVAGIVNNPKPSLIADPAFHQPAGFNPITASDAQLQQFGYPARPDRDTDSDAYAAWAHAMSVPLVRVASTHSLRADVVHHPNKPLQGTFNSSNWSGIVATGKYGQYNRAEMNWYVPPVSAPEADTPAYSSEWTGVDGFSKSKDLFQSGTEQDVYYFFGYELTSYYAWYEFVPDGGSSSIDDFNVYPGDEMYTQNNLCYDSSHNAMGCYWVEDITQGESVEEYEYPSTSLTLNSAEWVMERPTVGGGLYDLPAYGFNQPWNMYAWDTLKKGWRKYSLETYDTISMYNGKDELSTGIYMYPGNTAAFFWFNYQ